MIHRRAPRLLALALSLLLLAVACSDDDPASPATTVPASAPITTAPLLTATTAPTTTALDLSDVEATPAFCEAAQSLVDLDARTTPLMNTILAAADEPPSTEVDVGSALTDLEALAPEITAAYAGLAAAAPPELASPIADFQAGTLVVLDALREAADTGDVEGALGGIDGEVSRRAVDGAQAISALTESDCGFSLTD